MAKFFFYSCSLYFFLLAFLGYPYGEDAHTEMLCYLKYECNNNLYAKDFFVQSITSNSINERYFFVKILTLVKNNLSISVFFAHLTITLATFLGLFKIAKNYLVDENLIWLLLFVLFVPFSYISFGSNFLYNNEFVSGSLSTTICIWALFFFIEKKYLIFSLLSALATLFHPIVGTQLFILCLGAYFFSEYKNLFSFKHKKLIVSILVYVLIVGFPLCLLFKYFTSGEISNEEVYQLVTFRLPHHFIPSLFSLRNYVVLVPLLGFAIAFFYQKDKVVFGFLLTILFSNLVYIFCTDLLHSPILFFSQWTRSSVWMMPFALIAVFCWVETKFVFLLKKMNNLPNFITVLFIFQLLFAFFIIVNPMKFSNTRHYNLPFLSYENTPSIAISLQAKDIVPQDALFVQPTTLNLIKFFGEKSSYVNMIAFPNSKVFYKEWRRRIAKVYHVGPSDIFGNYQKMTTQADENFYALREPDFYALNNEGITHIFTKKTHNLAFPKVLENSEFIIYKIE